MWVDKKNKNGFLFCIVSDLLYLCSQLEKTMIKKEGYAYTESD